MCSVHIDEGRNLWILDALEDGIYFFSPIKLSHGQKLLYCRSDIKITQEGA